MRSRLFSASRWVSVSAVLLSIASGASGGEGEAVEAGAKMLLERAFARDVVTSFDSSLDLVRRVTFANVDRVNSQVLRSYYYRLRWTRYSGVRLKLEKDLLEIKNAVDASRKQRGIPGEVNLDAPMDAADRAAVEKFVKKKMNAKGLRNLVDKAGAYTSTPKPHTHSTPQDANAAASENEFLEGGVDEAVEGGGINAIGTGEEISAAAGAAAAASNVSTRTINLLAARLQFFAQLNVKFQNYKDFFKAFMLSENQWKTIFKFSSKKFTVQNLVDIRRLNRVLFAMNDYAKTREVMRIFVSGDPAKYAQLNEMTRELETQVVDGTLTLDDFVKARAQKAEEMGLGSAIGEAEARMAATRKNLDHLAGVEGKPGSEPTGLLDMGELNFLTYKNQIALAEKEIADTAKRIKGLKAKLKGATPENKIKIQQAISHFETVGGNAKTKLASARRNMHSEAHHLRDVYGEEVKYWESLDTFVNIPFGRMNSERVPAFDIPQVLIPEARKIDHWEPFYGRALHNSTRDLAFGEARLWYETRIGKTRNDIQYLNGLAQKYVGVRFTETRFGKDFFKFNKSLARLGLTRIGAILGVTIPGSVATAYADKIQQYFLGANEPLPADPDRPPGGSNPIGGGTVQPQPQGPGPAPGPFLDPSTIEPKPDGTPGDSEPPVPDVPDNDGQSHGQSSGNPFEGLQ